MKTINTRTTKITPRKDGDSLDRYLKDIARYKVLTLEEEVDLFKKLQILNPDQKEIDDLDKETKIKFLEIRNKISNANLRFVVSVAKEYKQYNIPIQELINEGNIGLLKAINRFDVTRGFKFISYAVWWIRQNILQYIANNSHIRRPMSQESIHSKVKKFTAKFEQEHHYYPSDKEIQEGLGRSNDEMKDYNDMIATRRVQWLEDTGYTEDSPLGDIIENVDSERPDFNIEQESTTAELLRVLDKIPKREKDVITMFYGLGKEREYTLEEIAEILDMSRERVRQIRNRGCQRMHSILSSSKESYNID